ncbi:hypothetical protein Tco_1296709 [Tanacetum coccineum]
MSRSTSLLSIKSTGALVPSDKRLGIKSSNDEFKYQITRRKTKPSKAEKIPYARFTKLIIDYLLSHNKTINKRSYAEMYSKSQDRKFKVFKMAKKGILTYGMQLPATMLNDVIKMMDEYKEYVAKNKQVVVPMVQPKPVDPIQGTHKKSRAGGVRKTEGKGTMMRGEELVEHVESFKTKIVLSTKKKPTLKAKQVKETYVYDPDQIHAATLLGMESERLRLERTEREQRIAEEEIDDDVDDTLKSKGSKLSRREILIQEMSRGQGERLETVDEGDEDDASNYTVFVHDKEKEVREKETPITKPLSSLRTESSQDDVLRYLNEPPGPSLGDVGLTGMQERQVTMTEPTGPNQRGFIVVNPVMNLTPGETPTLGSIPGGNPELISCTSGAYENPSDVLAQNLNLQVQPITGVDDPIPYPPITTISIIKPIIFKRKKYVRQIVTKAKQFNPMAKQFKAL